MFLIVNLSHSSLLGNQQSVFLKTHILNIFHTSVPPVLNLQQKQTRLYVRFQSLP